MLGTALPRLAAGSLCVFLALATNLAQAWTTTGRSSTWRPQRVLPRTLAGVLVVLLVTLAAPPLALLLALSIGKTEQRNQCAQPDARERCQEAPPRAAMEGTSNRVEAVGIH